MKKSNTNKEDIFGFNPKELAPEQQRQYLKKIVERANKRLQRIQKTGLYSYAYNRAMRDLSYFNRTRYSYKVKTPREVINEIYRVEAFLSLESSYAGKLRHLQKKAFDTLAARLEMEGIGDLRSIDLNRNDFYSFLSSRAFKDMKAQFGDSDWIVEDIASALIEDKLTLEEVIADYREFMKESLPLEAIKLRRKGAISSYEEYRNRRENIITGNR